MSSVREIEKRIVSLWLWLVLALPCTHFIYVDYAIHTAHQNMPEAQRCHANPEWEQHLNLSLQHIYPFWPAWYRQWALFQAHLYQCQKTQREAT